MSSSASRKTLASICVLLFAGLESSAAQAPCRVADLCDPSTVTHTYLSPFGQAIATTQGWALIGSSSRYLDEPSPGGPYVYEVVAMFDPAGPDEQVQTLSAPAGGSGQYFAGLFGSSVDADGSYAIVGAPGVGLAEGSAWVYGLNAGRWDIEAEVSEPGRNAGRLVAISGTTAAVVSESFLSAAPDSRILISERQGGAWVSTAAIAFDPSVSIRDMQLEGDTLALIVSEGQQASLIRYERKALGWEQVQVIQLGVATWSIELERGWLFAVAFDFAASYSALDIYSEVGGVWQLDQTLSAEELTGDPMSRIAWDMAADGNSAALRTRSPGGFPGLGALHVLALSSNGMWTVTDSVATYPPTVSEDGMAFLGDQLVVGCVYDKCLDAAGPSRVSLWKRSSCRYSVRDVSPSALVAIAPWQPKAETELVLNGAGLFKTYDVRVNDKYVDFTVGSDGLRVVVEEPLLGPNTIELFGWEESEVVTIEGELPAVAALTGSSGAPIRAEVFGDSSHQVWLFGSLTFEPTLVPGRFELGIGAQFADLRLIDVLTPGSDGFASTEFSLPGISTLTQVYLQALDFDPLAPGPPFPATNVASALWIQF